MLQSFLGVFRTFSSMSEGSKAAGTVAGSRDIPKAHPDSCQGLGGVTLGWLEEGEQQRSPWWWLGQGQCCSSRDQRRVHPHRPLSRCCSGSGAAACVGHCHQATELGWDCDPDLQPQLQGQRGEQPSPSVDSPVTANSCQSSGEAAPPPA